MIKFNKASNSPPSTIGELPEPIIQKINHFLADKSQPTFNRSLIHTMESKDFTEEVKAEQGFIYRGMINKAPTLCAHCKHLNKQLYALNLFSQRNITTEVLLLNEHFEPVALCLKHQSIESSK